MTRRDAAAYAIIAAAGIAAVVLHFKAALSLPVPWPDEAHFLWPARALATSGTLWAPELHPDRALQWMPPTYSTAMAAVFWVFGPSLSVARHVSGLCVLGAAALLFVLGQRHPIASAVAAGLWVVSPSMVALGNVARMDAMMLVLVMAGFVGLHRDRAPRGLACLAAAAAVHPNGVIFLVAGGLWAALGRKRLKPSNRFDLIAVVLGVGTLVVAWITWSAGAGFGDDLQFQLDRKAGRDLLAPWLDRRSILLVLAVASMRLPGQRSLYVTLAAAALLARNLGREMWYAGFDPLFYAVMVLCLVDAARASGRAAFAPVVAIAIGVAAWTHHPAPSWRGMHLQSGPYTTERELELVRRELMRVADPVSVLPRGDAALFLDHPEVRIVDPVRHEFPPGPTLVHTSPHQQKRVGSKLEARVRQAGALELVHGWFLLPAGDP